MAKTTNYKRRIVDLNGCRYVLVTYHDLDADEDKTVLFYTNGRRVSLDKQTKLLDYL